MCAACSKAPGPLGQAFYKVSAVTQPVPKPVIPFGGAAWDGSGKMGKDRGEIAGGSVQKAPGLSFPPSPQHLQINGNFSFQ